MKDIKTLTAAVVLGGLLSLGVLTTCSSCVTTGDLGAIDARIVQVELEALGSDMADLALLFQDSDPELASKLADMALSVGIVSAQLERYLDGESSAVDLRLAVRVALDSVAALSDDPKVQGYLFAARAVLRRVESYSTSE